MQETEIRGIQRRARAYWFEDGVPELGASAMILMLGSFFFAPPELRRYLLGLVFPAIGVASALTYRRLLVWIKTRSTFQRTGYAVPARPSARQNVLGLLFMAALILAISWAGQALTGSALGSDPETTLTTLAGSAGLVAIGIWLPLRRFVLVGLFALVVAAGLPLTGLAGPRQMGVHILALGAALLLSGAVTLAGYLRKTRAPAES